MKRILIALLAFIVLGAAYHFSQRADRGKTVQANAPASLVAVHVVSPERKTVQRKVDVYGSLTPKTSTELKSEILGRIQRVNVKEWDQVKPGDRLLEVDPTDFKLDLGRIEAGIQMARAQMMEAQVALNRAKRELTRAQRLKEGGLITGQELDERQTSVEAAEARVALTRAQVGQAEAQAAAARHTLQKATVESPIEGIVSQRKVDVGDFLDKGTSMFTLVDNRILDFTANVPATDLNRVSEGQLLTFTVDGIPERTFKGHVKRVNPTVSATDRSGRILAEVANHDGLLRGGVYAHGQVLVEERPSAIVLPRDTLVSWDLEKEAANVFVVEPGDVIRSRAVTTGLVEDGLVEIRQGLTGSERIVIRGGFNTREGEQVRVIDASAPEGAGSKPAPTAPASSAAKYRDKESRVRFSGRHPGAGRDDVHFDYGHLVAWRCTMRGAS
ncbi:MAG: efflux RND transporter periplasmic adaptor subunit [Syntrophobacteraceae bacterium]